MKTWWLGGLVLGVLLQTETATAQHSICGKPPEWEIKSQNTEKLKGDLQGKAQLLTKYLGSAELSGQIQTERQTIYQNSEQPEARRQDAYLAYMFCVLIMDDRTLSTNDKIKAINEFKQPVRKSALPERIISATLGAPMPPCNFGESLRPTGDIFHVAFTVMEDGPELQSIIHESRATKGYYGRELFEGLNSGRIQRFVGVGEIRVVFLGLNAAMFPRQIAFLAGRGICQWMVSVTLASGTLEVTIPIRGGEFLGQAGLALPKDVFLAADNPTICAQTNFPLTHLPYIADRPLKGEPNTFCTGTIKAIRPLRESIRSGVPFRGFFLVRGRA
jgi:hypothetical protein